MSSLEWSTKSRASDAAFVLQLRHDLAHHIDRNRKTDTLVASATRQDRGVDTDDFAFCIDQRPAGVSGIYGRIGLNEILVIFDPQTAAARRADDTHGHGLPETKGIADGERNVSDFNFARCRPDVHKAGWWHPLLRVRHRFSDLCR